MTAPRKRRAIPPFKVRRNAAGYVDGITRGGWTLLHLATSQRNEEYAQAIVDRLNAAPLDCEKGEKQALNAEVALRTLAPAPRPATPDGGRK